MKPGKNVDMVMFESGGKYSSLRKTLTVLLQQDHVLMIFSDDSGCPAETVTLSMDDSRAVGLGLRKLVKGFGRLIDKSEREAAKTHYVDAESGLTLDIDVTTNGEPYREEVSVVFRTKECDFYASHDLGVDQAHMLANLLEKIGGQQ